MSALGQKQTYAVHNGMSALPPIATAEADMCGALAHVRFGPKADMCGAKGALPPKADIDPSRREVCFVPDADFVTSTSWALHYIEPVWQLVGRAVGWRMGRKHVTAALDRRDEAGSDLVGAHISGQRINRGLPFRMINLLGYPLVGNDPCVVFCQRYKDQYAGTAPCATNPAYDELLERGAMCSGPLHWARNER